MNFEDGKKLISMIEQTRKALNEENYQIDNASCRITGTSSTDEMWKRIKIEHAGKKQEVEEKLRGLYKEFACFKGVVNDLDWKNLLEMLGTAIAKTSNIEGVAANVYDEKDLHGAISQTLGAIDEGNYKLKLARENGNEDEVVFINAQLQYYTNDIAKHHWGSDALNRSSFWENEYETTRVQTSIQQGEVTSPKQQLEQLKTEILAIKKRMDIISDATRTYDLEIKNKYPEVYAAYSNNMAELPKHKLPNFGLGSMPTNELINRLNELLPFYRSALAAYEEFASKCHEEHLKRKQAKQEGYSKSQVIPTLETLEILSKASNQSFHQ